MLLLCYKPGADLIWKNNLQPVVLPCAKMRFLQILSQHNGSIACNTPKVFCHFPHIR